MNEELSTTAQLQSFDEKMIEIIKMHKWFGDFHVLQGIDLTVGKGERIVICGPSGSGKSTLIRCINRIEEHQKGRIIVDGIELTNNKEYRKDTDRSRYGFSAFQSFSPPYHSRQLDSGAHMGEKNTKSQGRRRSHALS